MKFKKKEETLIKKNLMQIFLQYKKRIPWLRGLGIGTKEVMARPTEDKCLIFYVGVKFPKSKLAADSIIPDSIQLEEKDIAIEMKTDIVRLGALSSLSCNCNMYIPTGIGTCAAPYGEDSWGTIGGILRNPENGKYYIMSNAHVLSGFMNQYGKGYPIVHPYSNDRIGCLDNFTMLNTFQNLSSDAAIAEVDNEDFLERFKSENHFQKYLATPFNGMRIKIFGARSCQSYGYINSMHTITTVNYTYQFSNLMILSNVSNKGDSGSIVYDDSDNIVGLLIADDNIRSAAIPISAVVSDLSLVGWEWF